MHRLTVGAIVMRGRRVLLVKHAYGPTQGRWDFPRGHVGELEPPEAAAVREVAEETGLAATPLRIIAVRHQVSPGRDGVPRGDLLLAFHLVHEAGEPVPDGREVTEATYLDLTEALGAPDVTAWAKELIRTATASSGGLTESAYRPGRLPEGTQHWKLYT